MTKHKKQLQYFRIRFQVQPNCYFKHSFDRLSLSHLLLRNLLETFAGCGSATTFTPFVYYFRKWIEGTLPKI